MRLLVTGAAGLLGRDVVRAALAAGHETVGLSRPELDVTDAQAVVRAVASHRPEALVNCAAWADVDGAEAAEAPAEAVNGRGAGNVARAAAQAGASVVHLSSDYVFDGRKDAPYVESDPPAPISAYGRSKLAGERAVATSGARHAIVRSSWLFGAHGENFVSAILARAAESDELRVVTDQIGCPTYSGHLAAALVALAEGGAEGTFHVAGTGAATRHALAVEALRLAGLERRVATASTEEFPRPARRPAYSVLISERADAPRLPPWQEGLAAYMAERARVAA
jgi:dTDP-4-dehydrorhamnose reductase